MRHVQDGVNNDERLGCNLLSGADLGRTLAMNLLKARPVYHWLSLAPRAASRQHHPST